MEKGHVGWSPDYQTQYKGEFMGFQVYTDPKIDPDLLVMKPGGLMPFNPEVDKLREELSELKGKLLVIGEALVDIENTWSEEHQKEVDGWNEPSKIATQALKATQPDIQRIRDEIRGEAVREERERIEKALRAKRLTTPLSGHMRYADLVLFADVLQSLLPKKEVE